VTGPGRPPRAHRRAYREIARGSAVTLVGVTLHFVLQYVLWLTVSHGWGAGSYIANCTIANNTAGEWTGGHLGDVAVAAKRTLFHDFEKGMILSAAGELKLPTGDEAEGLGTGTAAFEPFVSFGQILPGGGFIHLQGGVEVPFDRDVAEAEAFWRFAPGISFVQGRFGRTWSPMVELLGVRELESGVETEWDLVPQIQVTLSQRQHVMVNVGVRVPLNGGGSRHEELLIYLLWDFFDGGFFEGW